MSKLFNTTFEIALRVLLTLSTREAPVGFDDIVISDFITTYGMDFGVSDYNLHGNNMYHFSELAVRRKLIKKAIQRNILNGLVQPLNGKNGFMYILTKDGKKLSTTFTSIYAKKYIEIAKNTSLLMDEKSITEIWALIHRSATLGGYSHD